MEVIRSNKGKLFQAINREHQEGETVQNNCNQVYMQLDACRFCRGGFVVAVLSHDGFVQWMFCRGGFDVVYFVDGGLWYDLTMHARV